VREVSLRDDEILRDLRELTVTLPLGRAAVNIDRFREIANITPGTSATAVENQLFGYTRPGTVDENSYRRYPIVCVKAPWAVATLSRRDDGDILVCETTDPSWVSLFLVAGGVVTDFGGMLSHGPIVAREVGIPCVCGTQNASHRIKDGQQIRVDGNHGTVEMLD
jgi:phosphohistidine swiveling domain-containing protein